MLRYIRIGRDVMDLSKKRKFNGGGYQGSHGGHWERSGGNGIRKSEGQNHRNITVLGGGRGGHAGGRQDENNSGGGGAQGLNGNNINPPHQDEQRMWGGDQNFRDEVRSVYRELLIGGMR